MTHDDILPLIEGYKKFHKVYFERRDAPFLKLVREGQQPKVLVVACSDSRVDPALLLNCEPGELFTIRNVANLVPPYENDASYHGTSAALEFGICALNVQHLIILGHTPCGGIQTLLEKSRRHATAPTFLEKWLELAQEAHDATLANPHLHSLEEKVIACGHASLLHSLENLKTFPWIQSRVEEGTLHLHAWNFDMQQGILEAYDFQEKRFKNLNE